MTLVSIGVSVSYEEHFEWMREEREINLIQENR